MPHQSMPCTQPPAHGPAYFYVLIWKQIISLELGRQRVWLHVGEVIPGNWDCAEKTPSQHLLSFLFFFPEKGGGTECQHD